MGDLVGGAERWSSPATSEGLLLADHAPSNDHDNGKPVPDNSVSQPTASSKTEQGADVVWFSDLFDVGELF